MCVCVCVCMCVCARARARVCIITWYLYPHTCKSVHLLYVYIPTVYIYASTYLSVKPTRWLQGLEQAGMPQLKEQDVWPQSCTVFKSSSEWPSLSNPQTRWHKGAEHERRHGCASKHLCWASGSLLWKWAALAHAFEHVRWKHVWKCSCQTFPKV